MSLVTISVNKGTFTSKFILSFDGSGIRGAPATQFPLHIETELKQQNQLIRDYVDVYAGTSTGSIIVLALATTDLTMSVINDLYNFENTQEIFDPNKGLFKIDGISAPKNEANGKTNLLRKSMGNATLHNVGQDKHVLAVSYAIEKRAPMVIKSTIAAYSPAMSLMHLALHPPISQPMKWIYPPNPRMIFSL